MSEADAWEDFVSRRFYALAVHGVADDFSADVRMVGLDRGIRLAEVRAGGHDLRRSSRLVGHAPSDDLLFLVQIAGTARIEQTGTQLSLAAGQAAFCDPGSPYAIAGTAAHQLVTMVPRHQVLARGTDPADLRLRPLSLNSFPMRVFRLLAEEAVSDAGGQDDPGQSGVADAAADLLRSAVSLVMAGTAQPRSWSQEGQLRMVREYMLAHLSDADFTLEQVAAAGAMSLRQLGKIFEPDDSPAAFLRRERLRRARADLVDPAHELLTIAQIGGRWGFPDPSTFGRAYRRAYAETPLQTRRRGTLAED